MYNQQLMIKCLLENKKIVKENLVKLSWGNYSCIDRNAGLIYIKPSGADLETIDFNDIAIVDLHGNQLSGMKMSVDTGIHLEIYAQFLEVQSVCHTHSTFATAYAQSGKNISVYGTTHADCFLGDILNVSPPQSIYELGKTHERELGKFIASQISKNNNGAILVNHHGPFIWSNDLDAVKLAIALEEIAKISFLTEALGCKVRIPQSISDFHWNRKHGKEKWYGQDGN